MSTRIAPMPRSATPARRSRSTSRIRATVSGDSVRATVGLDIDGAPFFLATESPGNGTRGPSSAGCTTVRIELSDDPIAVYRRRRRQRHRPGSVREHTHETLGPRPIGACCRLGRPSGHRWLIGKFLD